ncbi:jg18379, partial [Pararge aegeria aegeria]
VLSLSVLTEIPPKQLWIQSVGFNTSQLDVQFKKSLIYLSVDFLKIFPYNSFMVESQHWLLGMMFLLDPDLCHLRARWTPALFAEIRKTALQALVCTLHLMPTRLVTGHEIIRRIMWYIEWYSENPYELPVLYWCVRLLHAAIRVRGETTRPDTLRDLFDTHGIIILMRKHRNSILNNTRNA